MQATRYSSGKGRYYHHELQLCNRFFCGHHTTGLCITGHSRSTHQQCDTSSGTSQIFDSRGYSHISRHVGDAYSNSNRGHTWTSCSCTSSPLMPIKAVIPQNIEDHAKSRRPITTTATEIEIRTMATVRDPLCGGQREGSHRHDSYYDSSNRRWWRDQHPSLQDW